MQKMTPKLAIMGALPEEVQKIIFYMKECQRLEIGRRTYYTGLLFNTPVVLVHCRVGKVAAASSATTLIHHFNIQEILFTGVAGSADKNLKIGDIVIAKDLIQHDMDARPIFKQFEIPYLNKSHFPSDHTRLSQLLKATQKFINDDFYSSVDQKICTEFLIDKPQVVVADIASGDQFICNKNHLLQIKSNLPTIGCVEMEGAAVAQVCYEHGIPFSALRIISDSADDQAPPDFKKFVTSIATQYSFGIIKNLLHLI